MFCSSANQAGKLSYCAAWFFRQDFIFYRDSNTGRSGEESCCNCSRFDTFLDIWENNDPKSNCIWLQDRSVIVRVIKILNQFGDCCSPDVLYRHDSALTQAINNEEVFVLGIFHPTSHLQLFGIIMIFQHFLVKETSQMESLFKTSQSQMIFSSETRLKSVGELQLYSPLQSSSSHTS